MNINETNIKNEIKTFFVLFIPFTLLAIIIIALRGMADIAKILAILSCYYIVPVFISLTIFNRIVIEKIGRMNKVDFSILIIITCYLSITSIGNLYSISFENLFTWDMNKGFEDGYTSFDTYYHIALIKNIQEYGYSGTGLDADTYHRYHVLTHYIDAIIAKLINVDVFNFYPIVLHVKSITITSLIIILSLRYADVSKIFSLTLIVGAYSLLMGGYEIIGSHALWAPVLLIFIIYPSVREIIINLQYRNIMPLVFLGALLLFGKVSIGVAYFSIIGSYVFFKNPKKITSILFNVISIAVIILFYFYFWRTEINNEPNSIGVTEILYILKPIMYLIVFYAAICYADKKNYSMLVPIIFTCISITILAATKSNNINDVFYFIDAVRVILVIEIIIKIYEMIKDKESTSVILYLKKHAKKIYVDLIFNKSILKIISKNINEKISILSITISVGLLKFLSIFALIFVVNTGGNLNIIENLGRFNIGVFYENHMNSEVEKSVLTSLKNWNSSNGILKVNESIFSGLIDELKIIPIEKMNEAYLFITKNTWEEIEDKLGIHNSYEVALGLSAMLPSNFRLINAVPDLEFKQYGFKSYNKQSLRTEKLDVDKIKENVFVYQLIGLNSSQLIRNVNYE